MDLGTIKDRLESKYYWSARECLQDINQLFVNCHIYDKLSHDNVIKAQELERLYLRKVSNLSY